MELINMDSLKTRRKVLAMMEKYELMPIALAV